MKYSSVPLGGLVKISGGGTPSRNNDAYWGGCIPWATVKDLKDTTLSGTQETITPEGLRDSASNLIPSGSVIVATRMGLGKVAINTIDVTINQDLKAFSCSADLEPRYLLYFLLANASYLDSMGKGATVKGITLDVLKDLLVPLPPLPEQKRIAAILDKADSIRRKRQEAVRIIEDLLRSVFLDMFGDPESNNWPMTTIASVAQPSGGSIRTGPFGSQLLHSEFVDEGIAVLGIDNAVANEFRWNERRFITKAKYRELSRYTVKPGDVIITIMGTCGRCAVVPDDIPIAINTKHLCCITLDQTKCLPAYVHAYFLEHRIARRYLDQTAKGAIMAGLNMGIIKDMPIPIPPLQLQKKFACIIVGIEKLRNTHRSALKEQERLFSSTLNSVFKNGL
jgi:type I restriction enzyme S subunit